MSEIIASRATISEDFLEREVFVASLEHHINGLAEIELDLLPAPRVLAVDAPWGYGKSWIAAKLYERLNSTDGRAVTLIDAFRYDHHDDVFSVIASSAMKALKPRADRKRKLLIAAGRVLKAAAPVVVKGATGLALKMAGVDGASLSEATAKIKDALIDGAADYSAASIERLFEKYSKTQASQDEFVQALSSITKELAKPFVVIIDELDRCRPSFALEVLERIKHLFSADNVVFVLFWNSTSIRESVRHTYGRDTNAEAYLSKFVALSIPVPMPLDENVGPKSRYTSFVTKELLRTNPSLPLTIRQEFQSALTDFAGALDVSLRDVQKAIHLFNLAGSGVSDVMPEFAYLALIKVTAEKQFVRLLNLDAEAAAEELAKLPSLDDNDSSFTPAEQMVLLLTYLSQPWKYDELAGRRISGENQRDDNVIGYVGVGERQNRANCFRRAARAINQLLVTR